MTKSKKIKYNSLAGKFLLSSPGINDIRFKNTIVYVLSDNEEGSMGIIINKPALNISISSIIENKGLHVNKKKITEPKIFYGGPVELDKGFIIHTNDYKKSKKITLLENNLVLSSNISIIKDIMNGSGPSKSLFAIGYSGWDSYQLEMEVNQNAWLEVDLDIDILFSTNHKNKWEFCMNKLGIKPSLLKKAVFPPCSGTA
ncbi:YqgE/AlgH family protein [Alphaproteobacteria bacterium]|nr:YqgE/AlgH family protein [Alphaproteobacteria bacterium]